MLTDEAGRAGLPPLWITVREPKGGGVGLSTWFYVIFN